MRIVSGLSSILGDFHHSPTSTPETQGRKKMQKYQDNQALHSKHLSWLGPGLGS